MKLRLASCFLLMCLVSCAEAPEKIAPDHLTLTPVRFSDLPGWEDDTLSQAVPALARSCLVLTQKSEETPLGVAGKAGDWQELCHRLGSLPAADDRAARLFFESEFMPYAASGEAGSDGLFTGYYEAELHGSRKKQGKYQTPIYGRPQDLIMADLGDFRREWKGHRIQGKIVGNRLEPYDDRAAIAKGSLAGRAHVLLWVDDPVDAFFLAIQGSGRVRMTDGTTVRLGYDGGNGQPYMAIGRLMLDAGMIERPVTMQTIRTWLTAHPEFMQQTLNLNPSYVFFRVMKGDGPLGTEGVALTAGRSLAVDTAFISLGVPIWIDVKQLEAPEETFLQRLVIAQDTGGAIKGPVRGDLFWGFGPDAETAAGKMQNPGSYYVLLPRTVTPNAR